MHKPWRFLARFVLAIEPVHGRRRPFFQNHLDRLRCCVENFVHNFFLRLAERRQDVFHAVRNLAIGRNSQPNPQKLVRTQGTEDGFHPVVPTAFDPIGILNPGKVLGGRRDF